MKFKEWLALNEAPKDMAFQAPNVPYDIRQRYGPTGRYGTPSPELARAFNLVPAGIGASFDDIMYGRGSTARPGIGLGGDFPDKVDMPDDNAVTLVMPLMPKEWWGQDGAVYDSKLDGRSYKVVDQKTAEMAARAAGIDLCRSIFTANLMDAGMSEQEIHERYHEEPHIVEDRPEALSEPMNMHGVDYKAGDPGWRVRVEFQERYVYNPEDEVGRRSSDVIAGGHHGHGSSWQNQPHIPGQWGSAGQQTKYRTNRVY